VSKYCQKRKLKIAKEEFRERKNAKFGYSKNKAFQRSLHTELKKHLDLQKKLKNRDCASIVNRYFSENMFFFIFRQYFIPFQVSIWICMFRYRA
jgi:hypothetical protein